MKFTLTFLLFFTRRTCSTNDFPLTSLEMLNPGTPRSRAAVHVYWPRQNEAIDSPTVSVMDVRWEFRKKHSSNCTGSGNCSIIAQTGGINWIKGIHSKLKLMLTKITSIVIFIHENKWKTFMFLICSNFITERGDRRALVASVA